MQLFPDQDVCALGAAVGVLGMVLLLSLIVAYAYEEPTLLALAGYLAAMVTASFLRVRSNIGETRISQILLVTGPVLVCGLLLWLLKSRRAVVVARVGLAAVGVFSAVMVGLFTVTGGGTSGIDAVAASEGTTFVAVVPWFVLPLGFSIYLVLKSCLTASPWEWRVFAGHAAGLSAFAVFLCSFLGSEQAHWPLVLMLLLQLPPVYLALVWLSRMFNERRLRSAAAATIDPLTGLASTGVLLERLMRVMSLAHQSSTNSELFLIEVKNWNGPLNKLGAEFSEKILLEAALRLRRFIEDNDLGARIHRGRFAIVAQGLATDENITALATRLVGTGLRIESPVLKGVEFHFRVLFSNLKLTRPLLLPATLIWLQALATQIANWPPSHRTRSILFIAGSEPRAPDVLEGELDC
jgi:GGDEF domain-containing protein